ncbi:reverse transcriptase family protein [Ketobacter sp.]|uniref:reverse transcriptase family protein n=1 Tax=Ketobacter sp. TaxID=2083498 RepID=UPI000F0DEC8C|nr:reverse transcriptase family protein [Ketobacter sp.]RLU00979.1 MAG: RNA-directed DNA polymerase [Ketobacter sp.]
MLRDRYLIIKIPSIANTSSLASLLEITEKELFYIADNVHEFYKPGKIMRKKNGDPRPTHDAKPVLKQIHARIKNRILKQVVYPYYMLGGISDLESPRSCKTHAQIHSGKKILISEDIANFYPNTSYEVVKKIWKYHFKFGDEVSELLTKLTTFNGELPQGWKASGYIANLALIDKEPELVRILEEKGLSYSRFIDDITVSSPFYLTSNDKQFIISNIYAMLFSCGYKPKRIKHEIVSREMPMSVTSLNVNTKKPTIPSKERKIIRALVYQLECAYPDDGRSIRFYKLWLSVYGKVNRVKSFHAEEGSKLQIRMRQIKPPKHFFSNKKLLSTS